MILRPRPTPSGSRVVYALLFLFACLAIVLGTVRVGDQLQPMPAPIREASR